MYYSIYYINLDQLFQKVNIPKAISGHMCLIRYQNTCVLIRHFSVAKTPITHCSLYNKCLYPLINVWMPLCSNLCNFDISLKIDFKKLVCACGIHSSCPPARSFPKRTIVESCKRETMVWTPARGSLYLLVRNVTIFHAKWVFPSADWSS